MQQVDYYSQDGAEGVTTDFYSAENQEKLIGEMNARIRDLESGGNTITSVKRKRIKRSYIDAVKKAAESMGTTLNDEQAMMMAFDLQEKDRRESQSQKSSRDKRKAVKKRRKAKAKARRNNRR